MVNRGLSLLRPSEGAAFLDRVLDLPEEWAHDAQRRPEAGVPESVAFATQPQLAKRMRARTFKGEVACRWVVADTVYRALRHGLEERRPPFVLAVPSDEPLWWKEWHSVAAWEIAAQLPAESWQRLSAGEGAKGSRLYDWAWTPLGRRQLTAEERGWGHGLLVRRSLDDPTDLASYVVFAPREGITREVLGGVAGMRWRIESGFERAKGECGRDEYECHKWEAWHRHITLSLLADAVLAVIQAREKGAKLPATGFLGRFPKSDGCSVGSCGSDCHRRNTPFLSSGCGEASSTRRSIYLKDYTDGWEAVRERNAYFHFYNFPRFHQALGYQTPAHGYYQTVS